MEEQPQPKISTAEAIFIGLILLILDGLDAALVLTQVGIVVALLIEAVRLPATQIYLWFKGIKGAYMFVANGIKVIPELDILPADFIAWLIIVYLDRHPESLAAKAAQTAAAAAGKTIQ